MGLYEVPLSMSLLTFVDLDLSCGECYVISLYFMCCSINVSVYLVCCVFDSVCELVS